MLRASLLLIVMLAPHLAHARAAFAQPVAKTTGTTAANGTVDAAALSAEITDFLGAEVAAHLADIKSLDPPPARVVGAGATGDYTWGTFMRAVAAYAELSGKRTHAGRDLAREVGRIGLLEHRLRSTRFSQLYAVLALRHFGRDLDTNAVWQSLDEGERAQWRKLLDVSAFYDPKKQQVINLPENYLGVAARIASISYQLGLLKDRALLDGVITRAAHPFTDSGGSLYADDAPPTGRFDRYSNEYARFVWDAAEAAGRKDILDALRPTLNEQMHLWWDLVQPDGYGYAWGRSLGAISYMDTMEIVAFLARHAEFRPAPLEQLSSAYYQAWRWLRQDYKDKTHLLSVFAHGRGNYAYITREREWQQTTGFFGKAALAHKLFSEALARENLKSFPAEIARPDLARFVFFRQGPRQAGVWLVREGPLHFTLPITTGTRPGVADYLPAPHGLPGFAAPVEQVYPAFTSFIELADGRVLATADGADEIKVENGGRTVRAFWRRWAVVGGKSGELADPGITSEVVWLLNGTTLVREEAFTSSQDVTLRRLRFAVPTTAAHHRVRFEEGRRRDLLESSEGTLEVRASVDLPFDVSLAAPGDGALGRGARGAVPLHLI
ncbi:MAG TPA: hypothetical protein VF064_04720, partial [Pyrinomonadaceae bacterium]